MSSEVAIEASGLGKAYLIYEKPQDRLKQMLLRWRKYYREYWAVQGVDLTIGKGETVGIIGRNGSGKSTLLQMIAGTLRPNAGTLSVNGRVAPLLELGAGFNPEFTGRENVKLAGTILGLSPDQVRERYDTITDFAGIGDFIDQPVKTYSSGMYARLAFAVAAHVDADIFIVDETLSVGDFAFQHKCLARLEERRQAGATILFVSHEITQVRQICEKAVYLRDGRVELIGETKAVCDRYFEDLSELTADKPVRQIADSVPEEGERAHKTVAATLDPAVQARFEAAARSTRTGSRRRGAILCCSINGSVATPASIAFGNLIDLDIDIAIHDEFPNATVSFYVIDRAGQLLVGSNTLYEELDPHALEATGQHRISARLENRFQAGEYAVTVILSAFDPVRRTEYEDYITIAARFVSTPAKGKERWAFFNPRFELEHQITSAAYEEHAVGE